MDSFQVELQRRRLGRSIELPPLDRPAPPIPVISLYEVTFTSLVKEMTNRNICISTIILLLSIQLNRFTFLA